jgi:hypothetical protein
LTGRQQWPWVACCQPVDVTTRAAARSGGECVVLGEPGRRSGSGEPIGVVQRRGPARPCGWPSLAATRICDGARTLVAVHYEIRSSAHAVAAWSEVRLPFEPRGWQLQMRDELRLALRALARVDRPALAARYDAPDDTFADLESVLLYSGGRSRDGYHEVEYRVVAQPPPRPGGPPYAQIHADLGTRIPAFDQDVPQRCSGPGPRCPGLIARRVGPHGKTRRDRPQFQAKARPRTGITCARTVA